jgi:glycine/D-amino acid oxidase-like deaminating enzyme
MKNYDVIIVGGGIIGKAIAFKLLDSRLKILCIDPQYKKNGSASYAAGAMLGAYGEITIDKTKKLDIEEINFRIEAQKYYPSWLEQIEERSGRSIFRKMGTFLIANVAGKQDHLNLKKIAEELASRKEEFQWVDPTEIPNFHPNPDYLAYQALYLAHEGSLNTTDLMESLDQAISNSDIHLMDKVVDKLIIENNEVTGVMVSDEKIKAHKVVLCAGVGIQSILNETNLLSEIPYLLPGKGASLVVASDIPFSHVIRTPNRDFACGTHIVPRSDSTVYVGATNRISSTPGISDGVTSGEVHSLLHSAIHEIHTGFRTANIEKFYFGSRPITTDRYPIVGESGIVGLYVATGTYRNGILMSPIIAEIIGSKILQTNSEFDNPFSIGNRKLELNKVNESQDTLIENGIRDLVSFIQEPTGALPYNRSQELTDFITTLTSMLLTDDKHKYKSLIDDSKKLLDKYPIAEIVPQLFYKYHQYKETERIR